VKAAIGFVSRERGRITRAKPRESVIRGRYGDTSHHCCRAVQLFAVLTQGVLYPAPNPIALLRAQTTPAPSTIPIPAAAYLIASLVSAQQR